MMTVLRFLKTISDMAADYFIYFPDSKLSKEVAGCSLLTKA